ncbi:MAG TPA: TetR family transcriptional regulator [Conexibacter sp.]|nr:TetR family transcriptional regulator [Conexibacter sp.]
MSTPSQSRRVSAADARARILAAARSLLLERPFAELTVELVMAQAGLARTVFYRHYADLPQLAPDLLPDTDDPIINHIERVEAEQPEAVVEAMVAALVDVYAEHGPLLRAIDDAARQDRDVAQQLESALVGPRRLIARLLRGAPHPPPNVQEAARVLMAAHRAYLLDTFGDGRAGRRAKPAARAALGAIWARLLA